VFQNLNLKKEGDFNYERVNFDLEFYEGPNGCLLITGEKKIKRG